MLLQCHHSHTPTFTTAANAAEPELANQLIRPYSDLLLHDMGEGLADNRMDSGHVERPWKAPSWLIGLNTVLAFVNALFLGAGAKVWGYANALWIGFAFAALILPVFAYRHYVRDGGKFPAGAMDDLGLVGQDLGVKKAGILPYLALAGGLAIVLIANWVFQLPA